MARSDHDAVGGLGPGGAAQYCRGMNLKAVLVVVAILPVSSDCSARESGPSHHTAVTVTVNVASLSQPPASEPECQWPPKWYGSLAGRGEATWCQP